MSSLFSPQFKRLVRLTFWLVGTVILVCTLTLAAFFLRSDIYSFRPRLPAIKTVIETQRQATPVIPPLLSHYLDLDAPYLSPDQFVAKRLLSVRGLDQGITNSHRHVRTYFWSWSLALHLTKEERGMLHCAFLSDDGGHLGVHHLAQKLHAKGLELLNEREISELVVASRSPGWYLRSKELLSKHAEELRARSVVN